MVYTEMPWTREASLAKWWAKILQNKFQLLKILNGLQIPKQEVQRLYRTEDRYSFWSREEFVVLLCRHLEISVSTSDQG